MASPSLRYRSARVCPHVPITRPHVLLLVSLSAATAVWAWFVISGQPVGESGEYLALLGLYGVSSATFVFTRIKENHLRFFDLPVFLTIIMFIEFGVAPLECFVNPAQLDSGVAGNPALLPAARLYALGGMVAFGAGGALTVGRAHSRDTRAVPADEKKTGRAQVRIIRSTLAMYVVAFAVRVYLLTHDLYSYLGSGTQYRQQLASMQVWMVVASFGTYALVIACIEKYLRPADATWKLIFWAIFASECLWGLISGMKENLLQNFVVVAMVSSLVQRKFRKGWVIAAVIGLIVMYPVYNAYRGLVRGHGQQVSSLAGAAKAGQDALAQTGNETSGPGAEIASGFRETASRLDLLQSVGLVMSLGPGASQLLGGERWWMLPFYPFIPRLIWHSKPVLIEGGRFSVALGYGAAGSTAWTVGTSTGVTYPGDLYARGGLAGIILGMFILGIVAQRLTNRVRGALDNRFLFIYAAIFLNITDMEIDSFAFWSSLIKSLAILSVIAWFIYGPRPRSAKHPAAARRAFART